MKFFAIVCALFAAVPAFADTFSYRLFEVSIGESTPFVLNVTLDGPFAYGTKVTQITLTENLRTGKTLLFSWNGAALAKVFRISWKGNALVIATPDNAPSFRAVVKKEVSNGWGDTPITPGDRYSAHIEYPITLTPSGVSSKEPYFEISNQTVEEMCLWGMLRK